MTPEEEIQRGEEAHRILNSAVFQDALAKLKQELIEKWSSAPSRDTEGREWLWQHYQVVLKFEENFQHIINTGKLARTVEREQTIADRVRRFVR